MHKIKTAFVFMELGEEHMNCKTMEDVQSLVVIGSMKEIKRVMRKYQREYNIFDLGQGKSVLRT